ncbi:Thiopurine S-methyltransferase [compost metagenome]
MRADYLRLLSQLLPAGAEGLLVTLDYQQALLAGPPFSVADDEVRAGFVGWQVKMLEEREVIEESPKFVQAGVKSLVERVYRLQF